MRHEVEVDERIAARYEAFVRAQLAEQHEDVHVRHVAGQKQVYEFGRQPYWNGTLQEAVDVVTARGDQYQVSYGAKASDVLAKWDAAHEATGDRWAEWQDAEQEYGGWSRFYLVVDGHIHRSLRCSTCYDTTRFGWLTELSGLTEVEAVAEYGAVLCSVCYPSAPVEYVGGKSDGLTLTERAARKAEKDAEKASKDAAKAEKAIVDVDGSALRVDGDTLRTKVAARNALTRHIEYAVFYGVDGHAGHIRHLAVALEAAGVDWRTPGAKAVKRHVKDGGDHGAAVSALLAECGKVAA